MISRFDSHHSIIKTVLINIKCFFGLSLRQHRYLNNKKDLDLQTEEIFQDSLAANEGSPIKASLNPPQNQRESTFQNFLSRESSREVPASGTTGSSSSDFEVKNLFPFSISHLSFPQADSPRWQQTWPPPAARVTLSLKPVNPMKRGLSWNDLDWPNMCLSFDRLLCPDGQGTITSSILITVPTSQFLMGTRKDSKRQPHLNHIKQAPCKREALSALEVAKRSLLGKAEQAQFAKEKEGGLNYRSKAQKKPRSEKLDES